MKWIAIRALMVLAIIGAVLAPAITFSRTPPAAGYILVLGLVLPNGKIIGDVMQMPSLAVCVRAHDEFLKAPEVLDSDEPKLRNARTAACLTVPSQGTDT